VSVDSNVRISGEAGINKNIDHNKLEDNALGVSSPSSKAPASFKFDLVPRKLEWPCAVEGIMNVIAS